MWKYQNEEYELNTEHLMDAEIEFNEGVTLRWVQDNLFYALFFFDKGMTYDYAEYGNPHDVYMDYARADFNELELDMIHAETINMTIALKAILAFERINRQFYIWSPKSDEL